MILYVSTSGSDTNRGTSRDAPLATIRHAFSLAQPGDSIQLLSSIFAERMLLPSTINGSAERGYITLESDPYLDDPVTIDGSSVTAENADWQASVFAILGNSYLKFKNLKIENDGETWAPGAHWTITGFLIGSRNPSTGVLSTPGDWGFSHVVFDNVELSNINKTSHIQSYAVPVLVYSHGDERVGGYRGHHFEFRSGAIHDCETYDSANSIFHSHIEIVGNVDNWIIDNSSFYNGATTQTTPLQLGGNQSLTAYPNQPRRGVISRNHTHDTYDQSYSFYIQAGQDILIERNLIERGGYGIGINTETGSPGAPGYDISRRILCRNNLSRSLNYAAYVAGAWASSYDDVSDVWIIRNTDTRTVASPISSSVASVFLLGGHPGKDGVIGDSAIRGNIFSSPESVLFCNIGNPADGLIDRNLYMTDSETAWAWNNVDTAFPYDSDQDTNSAVSTTTSHQFHLPLSVPSGARLLAESDAVGIAIPETPSWYQPGQFGDYEPDRELDYFGTPISPAATTLDAGCGQMSRVKF